MLAEKLPSPEYAAVMECEPTDKLESASCAMLPETGAEPREVAPSKKVTTPVGEPPAEG